MTDYLIYDLETTSLDTDSAEIVCIGVYTSWDNQTHCIWKKDIHLFYRINALRKIQAKKLPEVKMDNRLSTEGKAVQIHFI